MWRGALGRCPACGTGKLWAAFLKACPYCGTCGAEFHHHRADDAPPYFTIFIIGHVLIPLVVYIEIAYQLPYWLHAIIWLPVGLAMTFALMPIVKGAIIGLQWALRMDGFGQDPPKP